MTKNPHERLLSPVRSAGIDVVRVEERRFPDETWLLVHVPSDRLALAQTLVGEVEKLAADEGGSETISVIFRPSVDDSLVEPEETPKGRLSSRDIDRLIQLLEARSRTSDALPSLNYIEDPRASLGALAASRHQLVFGRRGVGKTALLLESKRGADASGAATVWMNSQTLRRLDPREAFRVVAGLLLDAVASHGSSSTSSHFDQLGQMRLALDGVAAGELDGLIPQMNVALRRVLREGVLTLFVYLDDFYLLDVDAQPVLLDMLASVLRDCNGWIKVASIERLTRTYEPSRRMGLELPHDATKIDLDVTLESPVDTQRFLESILKNYVSAAGIRSVESLTKPEARGRLVLASGGVPRDYLNLFAASILAARSDRAAAEVGREDVARAAKQASADKVRDLEQDADQENSTRLLNALGALGDQVRAAGYSFFRVDSAQKGLEGYRLLELLSDLRFAHVVLASFSDQKKSGVRYEAFTLDLSEYAEVRLKRGLSILDLADGTWTLRKTGSGRQAETLSGNLFRDALRKSPLIDISAIA